MAIKKYKPTTPGRRGMTVTDYSVLSKVEPERSLLQPKKKHAGRNNTGKITVRHHGGGNRVKYRVIDFKRNKFDVPATVMTLEYDPNRSAFIALVQYEDGVKSYILAPDGLKVGDKVMAGPHADIKPGNALPFENIPVGTMIHNIELYPGKGGQLVRSAGVMAQLMAKENGYALVRLPSGEMRNIPLNCIATIGVVSNLDHENVNLGKAGRKRHMGVRPGSRGTVMNPCDHPPQTSCSLRQVHRQARQRLREVKYYVSQHQKRPLRPAFSDEESRSHERERQEERRQDLEPRLHHLPGIRRPHLRRPRRPQACARLCHRGYGRPQAR